jgi:hypothetical protein
VTFERRDDVRAWTVGARAIERGDDQYLVDGDRGDPRGL